jgi:3-hydroxyacyl-[acyl-carrier-protein] dehydratase
MNMNIQQILERLPHRFPFLLVDRVIEFERDKTLLAIKNVSINEPFFAGHFPVKAVMPGVLIVEALAQAAAILASHSADWKPDGSLFYLGSIENARFRKMVVPGDQLHLNVEILKRRAQIWKFKGVATVEGEVVCTAEMTSAQGSTKDIKS